jgi:hypothetical protein
MKTLLIFFMPKPFSIHLRLKSSVYISAINWGRAANRAISYLRLASRRNSYSLMIPAYHIDNAG